MQHFYETFGKILFNKLPPPLLPYLFIRNPTEHTKIGKRKEYHCYSCRPLYDLVHAYQGTLATPGDTILTLLGSSAASIFVLVFFLVPNLVQPAQKYYLYIYIDIYFIFICLFVYLFLCMYNFSVAYLSILQRVHSQALAPPGAAQVELRVPRGLLQARGIAASRACLRDFSRRCDV